MRKNYSPLLIPALSLTLALTGCLRDETTLADYTLLTEIVIDTTSMASTYNILAGDTLFLTPRVTQKGEEKALTFAWEVNQHIISTESTLAYAGHELGVFQCRLVVGNEDGKAFFPFVINVNTPYEEGLTVLSVDDDGTSYLSFRLTPADGSDSRFYDYDCFTRANPDIPFAPHAVDMVHTENSLYILCQGSEQVAPTIYNLQHKTLQMKNYIQVTTFPDFIPTRFLLPGKPYPGNHYPILCADGRTYDFGSENVVGLPTKLQATYAQKTLMFDSRSSNYYYSIFWDLDAGDLAMLYTGYGPFYASNTYNCSRDSVVQRPGTYNYFQGEEFVTMARTFVAADRSASWDPEIIVITKRAMGPLVNIKRTVLNYGFWVHNDEGDNVLSVSQPTKVCATITPGKAMPIDIDMPMTASKTYNALYYGNGAAVMQWNYITDMLTAATPLARVGTDTAVITDLLLADDQQSLYVAFYDPALNGTKQGSVWQVSTDDGHIIARYDGVCHRPVKIIYKSK